MKIFVPITKVDVEKREVWGRAVQEVPDKAKEIFDYETSVPYFKNWSASFEKATEALPEPSLGNIRAMHGKVAAGKVIAIDFNDTEKAIDIGTKIVDDNEWQKCVEGIYTGFSIGGSYVKKWKDGGDPTLTRYTANPAETSLVDNPCVDTARFSMVKADGAAEERGFQRYGLLKTQLDRTDLTIGELLSLAKTYLPEDSLAKADVEVKDILGELRALLEVPALEKAADAAPAAAAAGTAVVTESAAETPPAKVLKHLRKGMYTVQSFASILQSLAWLAQDAEAEKGWEQDASTVPADLRTAVQLLCEIFKKMSAEETDEMLASIVPDGVIIEVLELAAPAGELAKAGKRHSKGDQDMVQAIHDHAAGLGADCGGAEKMAKAVEATEALAIAKTSEATALEKVTTLEKAVGDLTTERDTLAKQVADLKAQPAAPKGVLRSVEKADDVTDLTKDTPAAPKPDPKDPLAVMKAVHATGGKRINI